MNNAPGVYKKIKVSRRTAKQKSSAATIAHSLLMESGFDDGTVAHVHHAHGRVHIVVGQMPHMFW